MNKKSAVPQTLRPASSSVRHRRAAWQHGMLWLAGTMGCCGSASAHHSYAMFQNTQITLTGTVKEFDWTNPHVFLTVEVPDGKGGQTLWAAEANGPGGLQKDGWNFHTLQVGEKVTVGLAPLRDGRHGGGLIFVTGPDGKRMSGGPLDHARNHPGGGPPGDQPPGGPGGGPPGDHPPGAPGGGPTQ